MPSVRRGRDQYPADERAAELARIFRGAVETITAQVQEALRTEDLARADRRRLALAAVVATLDRLGAEVQPLARRLVMDAVAQGADRAAQRLDELEVDQIRPAAFQQISREAVDALTASILGRTDIAIRTVGRTVEDVYARAGRRAALRAVLGADGSPREARRELMRELLRDREVRRLIAQDGVTGFVDRAGKRWRLDTYAEMVVRTTTREAVVQGAVARMLSHGVNVAEVSRHGTSCEICRPWEGRLVSLDGQAGDFEGEAITPLSALPNGGPPLHPNCKHTLQPFVVELERGRQRELPDNGAPDDISDTLDAAPTLNATVQRTAAAIGQVHRTRGLPTVRVEPLVGGSPGTRGDYSLGQRRIRIRREGPHPEFTLAHEIGHMLDHLQIGDSSWLASDGADAVLARWNTAVDDSAAVATLRAVVADRNTPPRLRRQIREYSLRAAELFARSYAQYIAVRSGDRLLLQQLETARNVFYGLQWEDDDFEPIADAFDDLFRTLGLR